MHRLCSVEDLEGFHKDICDEQCSRWKECISRKTGIDFSFNVDTYFINERVRRGGCPECGMQLCEHLLRYKEGYFPLN